MKTITLNVEIRVKPEGREELLETLRVLYSELPQEPTFVEAWLHTTAAELAAGGYGDRKPTS